MLFYVCGNVIDRFFNYNQLVKYEKQLWEITRNRVILSIESQINETQAYKIN